MDEETVFSKGFSTSPPLACPGCGEQNLHQGEVLVFDRVAEDSDQGTVTSSVSGQSRDGEMWRNPSKRRDGILIHFSCEHCDADPILAIVQHKGATFIYWKSYRVDFA